MNPRHVVSLALARKLKDAGFQQYTEFSWYDRKMQCDDRGDERYIVAESESDNILWHCSAPLASEIAERLVEKECGFEVEYDGRYRASHAKWDGYADTMPDALAALWLAVGGRDDA